VHVWPVSIQAPDSIVEQFQRLLAPDEADRAAKFRFHQLRTAYILGRGALRILLGRYLNSPPQDLTFRYGSKGKPTLDAPGPLQFNASHSGDLALFAFTMDCEIGVDVEAIRPMPDIENIARRFFCAEETVELMSLPAGQREHAFFLCWTRKEAYIKATGEGLSTPLDAFRVTLRPSEPAGMIQLAGDPIAARRWTLHDLPPAPGYAAAVAYRDAPRPLELFNRTNPKQLLDVM
jgi:4'-phosphopantetheinyl transferase